MYSNLALPSAIEILGSTCHMEVAAFSDCAMICQHTQFIHMNWLGEICFRFTVKMTPFLHVPLLQGGGDMKHNLCPSPAWQRLAKNSFLVSRHSSSSGTHSTTLHEFRVKPMSCPTESRTASSVFCVHNKGVWFARS